MKKQPDPAKSKIENDKSLAPKTELRSQAEKRLRVKTENLQQPSSENETKKLVHELQVHQIELEMQNEEMQRVHEGLETSHIRYVDLYDFAPIGYFSFDMNGLIAEVNFAGAKLLGVDRQDLINKPFSAFVLMDDQDIFRAYLREAAKRETSLIVEIRLEKRDGSAIIAQLYSVGADNYKGISKLCITAVIDITLRKQAEADIRTAYDSLELRVKERTEELSEANRNLQQEIEERKQTANLLREALKKVKQLKDQLHEENLYLKEECQLLHPHEDIIGNSDAIRNVLKQIEQVAETDSTVLIQGETGTGKELVANAIHSMSSRRDRLMIKVNCAALPPTLIESELFGREKGAFTGALSKQAGRFELANNSTIFLDEIDSLPLDLQAKLLRVLESGEFERLGSPNTMKINVRIISATNCDLAKVVSEGRFREDLYYRLNVFQIIVPPLRERREDILPLVWSFVKELSKRMGKRIESIPQKDVDALHAYHWPGNVRELRNITERAMIITTGSVLRLALPKIAKPAAQARTLEEVEKLHIMEALKTTGGKVSGKDGAAGLLGINPKTLESRMQKMGIHKPKKISDMSEDF